VRILCMFRRSASVEGGGKKRCNKLIDEKERERTFRALRKVNKEKTELRMKKESGFEKAKEKAGDGQGFLRVSEGSSQRPCTGRSSEKPIMKFAKKGKRFEVIGIEKLIVGKGGVNFKKKRSPRKWKNCQ